MKILISTAPFSKNADATYVNVVNNKVKNFVINSKYAHGVGIPAGTFAMVEYTTTKSKCKMYDNIQLALVCKFTASEYAKLVLSED